MQEEKYLEYTIGREQYFEMYCGECGREMTLNVRVKKKTRWDKGHAMWECSCGNKFRKRSVNEILRDIGEKE